MKVEQKKAKFSPITITLETEKEAEALWYALDCPDDEAREDYLKRMLRSKSDVDEMEDRAYEIFQDYNEVYEPNDC